MMRTLYKLFTDHPKSVDESYLEHASVAIFYSIKLFLASVACFVHAFLPFLFKSTASSMSRHVVRDVDRRVKGASPNSKIHYKINYRSHNEPKPSQSSK
jgi:hypothetical protein